MITWFVFWKLPWQTYYQQVAVEGNKKPDQMPALVKKPGQCTLGTKRNLKIGKLLKNYSQGCVFCLFLKLILGANILKAQHMQPRQGIWKPGKWERAWGWGLGWGDRNHNIKDHFFFKDFFATKKCKVIGRSMYPCLYLCRYLSIF